MSISDNVIKILRQYKRFVSARIQCRSIKVHRSRLPRKKAKEFSQYLVLCRREFREKVSTERWVLDARDQFNDCGFTSFHRPIAERVALDMQDQIYQDEQSGIDNWSADGEGSNSYVSASQYSDNGNFCSRFPEILTVVRDVMEPFLKATYESNFKIFYGLLYKSSAAHEPQGSQLWHSDGGPGTCIKVMYYLSEATAETGAIQFVDWRDSLPIFKTELLSDKKKKMEDVAIDKLGRSLTRMEVRDIQSQLMEQEILATCSDRIVQPCGPPGTVVPFLNNTLHRGGHHCSPKSRHVIVFSCYPSMKPTPYNQYLREGLMKSRPMPLDAAEER